MCLPKNKLLVYLLDICQHLWANCYVTGPVASRVTLFIHTPVSAQCFIQAWLVLLLLIARSLVLFVISLAAERCPVTTSAACYGLILSIFIKTSFIYTRMLSRLMLAFLLSGGGGALGRVTDTCFEDADGPWDTRNAQGDLGNGGVLAGSNTKLSRSETWSRFGDRW